MPPETQSIKDVTLTEDQLLTGWAMEIVALTYQGTGRATLANLKKHGPAVKAALEAGDFSLLPPD